jgi:hypothetical protein
MATSIETAVSKPTPGMGIGIFFLAGPTVVCIAGIGGHFGARIDDGIGYWIGCYAAGIIAAAAVAAIFSRLFRGRPLLWALGALGLLAGGHLTWFLLGGRSAVAPSGSDQLFITMAAILGMLLGFAAAMGIMARRRAGAA